MIGPVQIYVRVDVTNGLASMGTTFIRVLTGLNFGKTLSNSHVAMHASNRGPACEPSKMCRFYN